MTTVRDEQQLWGLSFCDYPEGDGVTAAGGTPDVLRVRADAGVFLVTVTQADGTEAAVKLNLGHVDHLIKYLPNVRDFMASGELAGAPAT